MTDAQQRAAARKFALEWVGKGSEKSQTHVFWLTLLRDVFAVQRPEEYVRFENEARLDKTTGLIDVVIPSTNVLIEQKSMHVSLDAKVRQSDGSFLTPFEQAHRYPFQIGYSDRPRWIVTCNFQHFYVYDMERPSAPLEKIQLVNLEK